MGEGEKGRGGQNVSDGAEERDDERTDGGNTPTDTGERCQFQLHCNVARDAGTRMPLVRTSHSYLIIALRTFDVGEARVVLEGGDAELHDGGAGEEDEADVDEEGTHERVAVLHGVDRH